MTASAVRLHRLLLLLLGLLLLATGGSALLAGLGGFGDPVRDRAVFDNSVSRYIGDHGSWMWPLLALAALLLAYLAVRWLLTLFHVAGVSRIDLTEGGAAGRTEVDSAALGAAVSTQVQGYRDVTSASAKVQGDARAPVVALTVTATADADLTALRQRIEAEALVDLRRALQSPDLAVRLDLRIGSRTGPRSR